MLLGEKGVPDVLFEELNVLPFRKGILLEAFDDKRNLPVVWFRRHVYKKGGSSRVLGLLKVVGFL